jgi:hypothetical protein
VEQHLHVRCRLPADTLGHGVDDGCVWFLSAAPLASALECCHPGCDSELPCFLQKPCLADPRFPGQDQQRRSVSIDVPLDELQLGSAADKEGHGLRTDVVCVTCR